jgi:hypothetical protein
MNLEIIPSYDGASLELTDDISLGLAEADMETFVVEICRSAPD